MVALLVFCASVSSAISSSLGLHGRSVSISDGCCSSTDAIAAAMDHIRLGFGDFALCGGADACVTRGVLSTFCKMGVVTTHFNDQPKQSCRPFHRNRDGFALGEGAWVMTIESYEHAKIRGATIYAELAGYGSSCDAFHPSRPHPDGIYSVEAIQQALFDAGFSPTQINYVSAYGNGSRINDPLETAVYKKAFGEHAYSLALSSVKSMIGHPIGATGAAQVVSSALAIQEGFIPPTVNLDDPDPLCDLDYVPNKARKQTVNAVLVNTLSFGGKNACLVIRKP
jgi:3-oxoacyl-[acyl-carrier-protein] synthase II